jgi:hypothetical protein
MPIQKFSRVLLFSRVEEEARQQSIKLIHAAVRATDALISPVAKD